MGPYLDAGVAHSVERNLAKVEVAGSKPVSRSITFLPKAAAPACRPCSSNALGGQQRPGRPRHSGSAGGAPAPDRPEALAGFYAGLMFWFNRKTLSGSYCRFTSDKR